MQRRPASERDAGPACILNDNQRILPRGKLMSQHPAALFLLCAFSVWSFSVSAQVPDRSKATDPASAKSTPDTCSLLSQAEIEKFLGEPVKEIKSSSQPVGGMLVSQCIFLTRTFANSLSLAVTSPDPAHSAKTVHDFWDHQFHSANSRSAEEPEGTRGAKGDDASQKQSSTQESEKPRLISGLGQEAYWVGSPITGALYVLQGGAFLRVSVGGIRQESARIDKSKAIAGATLSKLSASSLR